MIEIFENKYDGITVDNATLPKGKNEFKKEIIQLIESVKNKKILWINIPVEKSDFIPILTKLDFKFHHCNENCVMLFKMIAKDSIIPTAVNYIVGVGAVVIDNDRLLVVKDRLSNDYKLPGGHIEKKESLKNALKREVYEETGIDIDFESIVNIGHFKNGQFGESGIYIVCTANALSNQIKIGDTNEISEAKWMKLDDFLNSDITNPYNKSVIKAAVKNSGLKLIEQPIKLRVPDGEVFF